MNKLASIRLEKFLCHEKLDLDLGRVTYVTGANAVGKTSVANAIEFAIRGKTRGLKLKKECLHLGMNGKRGMVSLTADTGNMLRRDVKGKCTWTNEQIAANFGSDVLTQLLCDSFLIIRMDPTTRQKVMAEYAQSERKMGGWLVDQLGLPIERHGMGDLAEILRLADKDFEKAIKAAIELRREAKRKVGAARLESPPEDPVLELEGEDGTVTRARVMDHSLEKLQKVKGDRQTEYDKLLETHGALKIMNPEKAKEELETITASLKEAEGGEARMEALDKSAEEAHGRWRSRKNRAEALKTEADAARGNLASLQGQIEVLETTEKACPIVEVDCPLRTGKKDKLLASLSADLEAAQKEATEATEALEKAEASAAKQDSKVKDIEQEHFSLQVLVKNKGELTERKAELEKTVAALGDYEGIDQRMTDVKRRLDNAKAMLERRKILEADLTRHEAAHTAMAQLEPEVEAAEELVTLMETDGRAALAEQASSAELPKDLLTAWGMSSLRLTQEGSIVLDGRPIELCSLSEQLRAGVAIQAFLAMASDQCWFIVDEANLLAAPQATAFSAWAWSSNLVQVIILATTDKEPPTKLPEDVIYYRL